MLPPVLSRVFLALTAVVLLSSCRHQGVRLGPATSPIRHNVLRLGAHWGDVTAAVGVAAPPTTTAAGVTGTFGRCPAGAAAYTVRAMAAQSGQPVTDMAVVEIDAMSCSGAPTLGQAAAQARAFFPDLSGVVRRQPTAVLYSSQPLVRLVPPGAFFVCQSLASSAQRLGRFSLRLEPTGWVLAVGDCMSDAPPGSPNAR